MISQSIRWLTFTAMIAASLASTAHANIANNCGLTDTQKSRVSQLVKQMVERGYAPSAVLDIRCNGRHWLAQAEGTPEPSSSRTSHVDDIYRVYSMTKPITSLAVMMLADEGLLSVDDPVERFLPEFAKIAVWSGSDTMPPESTPPVRPVLIRDLLRHTAGFDYPSYGSSPIHKTYAIRGIDDGSGRVFVPTDGSAPVGSLQDLVTRLAEIPVLHQPGAKHSYGNSHDILGRLVESVAKKPFREFLKERVFTPLEMIDTAFDVSADRVGRFTAAYAAPVSGNPKRFLRDTRLSELSAGKTMLVESAAKSIFHKRRVADFGGAGLVSTASDYQRFMMFLMNDGEVNGKRLVSREALMPMYSNQLDPAMLRRTHYAQQGFGFGYGLTVVTDSQLAPAKLPQGTILWGGAASTYFWVDRKQGVTGTLLTQVFGGDVAPYFVAILEVLYAAEARGAH